MFTQMNSSLEIRKLQPGYVRELAQILEYAESWKRLMAIIPNHLGSNTFVCDIKIDNLPKYNSEHFKIIENASLKYKRSCTEILFDEWGTSGKIRPTLGHLKYLLAKAELFRAADYVAVELLREEPPERPSFGPAALVTTDLTEIKKNSGFDKIGPVEPAASIVPSNVALHHHFTNHQPSKNVIPDIVISEVIDVTPSDIIEVPIVKVKSKPVSDMMKFSSSASEDVTNELESGIIPEISSLLESPGPKEASESTVDSSESNELSSSSFKGLTGSFAPPIADLLAPECSESDLNFIPALSALNPVSEGIPNFEMLQASEEQMHSSNSSLQSRSSFNVSNGTDFLTSKCSSPLPNLYLNTELPHFTYGELAAATNNFNEEAYTNVDNAGRFLGSGAFGSVFLAPKLIDRPVAVKKIFLENAESVNEDDAVTKQFRNEVEVLCKYKHENLVSLLGYSCDGCTYCLVYEYVSGGALKDRLQDPSWRLMWKERLNIALGTASAVSYLHTGFSTSLIHRDIKTANILLDSEDNAKLCDFGLVKLLPSQKTNTHTAAYGTSAYMSPEAHRGDISVKLDTFSFGVVLLELLTSLPPIDYNRQGYDIVTHVEDHCDESITPLLDTSVGSWQENDINYGQKLYELAQKCLEEKKKRPSMVEVRDILNDLIPLPLSH
ncbi:interleukin-1 receptor-associated kinase 4-like [Cylas formicarius]|uniref:interleukin-1 receptor-associated kinase 4-like n=1 Tax=Cylas formicarius TaxID=197179 RepID=UPI002958C18E|nr:interleukin-1 receptor-associated kinase 4-like [Cylas formicarius]